MSRRRKFGAWLALVCLLIFAADRVVGPQAGRFLHYYRSLERADGRPSVWERLFYSLALAAAEPSGGAGGPKTGPAIHPSIPTS